MFLFSCYSGLAYIDVRNLRKQDLVIGPDGTEWILSRRTKTRTLAKIPLLAPAKRILDQYADQVSLENNARLLPVLSNQKMNAYLKEIADLCSISTNLTFHLARHTFATTVTLSNGVPIETVSKMLGHKDIRTTQLYAKVIGKMIIDDMAEVKLLYK
ncbi:MAG: site-specific integrase [Bacteroidota bacterium]